MIENGRVEFFFGGEVSKDHRFGDSRRVGDFFRRRSSKTPLRKEAHGHRENLELALFAGHASGSNRALTRHLLTQYSLPSLSPVMRKVSTYLPCGTKAV